LNWSPDEQWNFDTDADEDYIEDSTSYTDDNAVATEGEVGQPTRLNAEIVPQGEDVAPLRDAATPQGEHVKHQGEIATRGQEAVDAVTQHHHQHDVTLQNSHHPSSRPRRDAAERAMDTIIAQKIQDLEF